MKKIIWLVCLAIVIIILVGRQQTEEIKTDYADKGDVGIRGTAKDTDSWCQAGSEWKMRTGEGISTMIIEGIIASGKYAGYCHVKYDIATPGGETKVDLYFNEEGRGYQVMDVNGQKIESEWNK